MDKSSTLCKIKCLLAFKIDYLKSLNNDTYRRLSITQYFEWNTQAYARHQSSLTKIPANHASVVLDCLFLQMDLVKLL